MFAWILMLVMVRFLLRHGGELTVLVALHIGIVRVRMMMLGMLSGLLFIEDAFRARRGPDKVKYHGGKSLDGSNEEY